MVAFTVKASEEGDSSDLLVIYNANRSTEFFKLPDGEWDVFINGEKAGNDVLDTVSGKVSVSGISMVAAVKR